MADTTKTATSSGWWVRSAVNGQEFGPVSQAGLLSWAKQGRIFPDDFLSTDRQAWHSAREYPFLRMDTLVIFPDERVVGPLHADAVSVLKEAGKIPEGARILAVGDLLAEDSQAASQESSSEEFALLLDERMSAVQEQFRDQLAEKDREIERLTDEMEEATRQTEELRSEMRLSQDAHDRSLRTAEEKLRNAEAECAALKTRLAGAGEDAGQKDADLAAAKQESEKLAQEMADAKASFEKTLSQLKEELEASRTAQATAERERDEARDAADAAFATVPPATEQRLQELNEQLELQQQALAEARSQAAEAQELRQSLDEAQADAAALRKSGEEARIEWEKACEAARTECEQLKKRVGELQNEAGFHAGDLAVQEADAASIRKELEEARREYAELLAFSNMRDSQNAEKIARLEARVNELETAEPEAVLPSDLHGEARQVRVLQDKVTDLTRECGELADKLATANASLAMATRPLEGDIAVIKQFADEALLSLRETEEKEKARCEAFHASGLELQRSIHEKIQLLERALKRDPGEKSRSEMVAERNEKTIAQLRQELDSQREQHKADLARAAQTEKVLEGRVRSLRDRETSLREQLRRVEQRTADYDSLGTQLRRREEELLEAGHQFSEAREQWQVVESMLRRRIEELEHGAGSLFENMSAGLHAAKAQSSDTGAAAGAAGTSASAASQPVQAASAKQWNPPQWLNKMR